MTAGYDIAFLLGFPEISGGTNVILEHALGLTQRGHRVSIVTELPFDPQRLAWKPAALNLPLLCHADCRQREFDLAIATWWRSVYDLPHVPARGYAYFCQSIESRFFSPQQPDMKALVDYTYRQPLPIVTEATWIARHLRDLYGRETTLVLNGIDKQIFTPDGPALEPRPECGLRVLIEGPLGVPFKRVESTLELCRQAGIDDLWLLTATDCVSLPGVDRVCSKVRMPEVGQVYRSCDVLVKLSTVEGMFGPPLEMMHCGGTAITSDVTGHEEYMRHGENGFVVRRGEEAEVIRHLRALRQDPELLARLKAAGLETAARWPDWSHSVSQMDTFVRDVCERDWTQAVAQQHMRVHLDAALRLAGPLHESVQPQLTGRQHLRCAFDKLRTKLRSTLGRNSCEKPDVSRAVRVDVVSQHASTAAPRTPQEHYRLCFVADLSRYAAHIPASAERATVLSVDIPDGFTPATLERIAAFGPDYTLIFEPEHAPEEWLQRVAGYRVGYSLDAPTASGLRTLRSTFSRTQSNTAGLLHADTGVVTQLLAADLSVLGACLPPIDLATCGVAPDVVEWQQREIDVLLLGEPPQDAQHFIESLRPLTGFLHVPHKPADQVACGLLRRTKMALHIASPADAPLDAAKVLRDIAGGSIVLTQTLALDYDLMPGEHYLYFETPAQLRSVVRQQLRQPDQQDIMRRRALQRITRYDAQVAYITALERYLHERVRNSVTGQELSSRGRDPAARRS